jgi:hypothetical protein
VPHVPAVGDVGSARARRFLQISHEPCQGTSFCSL